MYASSSYEDPKRWQQEKLPETRWCLFTSMLCCKLRHAEKIIRGDPIHRFGTEAKVRHYDRVRKAPDVPLPPRVKSVADKVSQGQHRIILDIYSDIIG